MSRSRVLFRRFRWTRVPVGVGIGYVCYQQFGHIQQRHHPIDQQSFVWPQWKVSLYSSFPLRAGSRLFGAFCDMRLPRWIRRPIIGAYAYTFGCDLSEAVDADPAAYESLGAFFCRPLRLDVRPISESPLVVPSDSTVHQCGHVRHGGLIEQVKGIDYSVDEFLGRDCPEPANGRSLHFCVLYLAPGDYHGFHSPVDWTVAMRRHFSGLMLSVRAELLDRIPRLMCLNERVTLLGHWTHGFFSLTAVAATNVGNIRVEEDERLRTNVRTAAVAKCDDGDASIGALQYDTPRVRTRGQKIGEFRLGSSIVLIFEAPDSFRFCVRPGDKVVYGQSLGFVVPDDVDAPPQ